MTKNSKPTLAARRAFLAKLGGAVTCAGAIVGAATLGIMPGCLGENRTGHRWRFVSTKDYDWTKYQWGFGVDATKCIGCLRCVEACKTENDVPRQRAPVPHLGGALCPPRRRGARRASTASRTRSTSRPPVRKRPSASPTGYKDAKVDKAFFVPKLCNHCTHPACVQVCPTGATYKTKDGVVLIDQTYCIGCRYCVQACPYGARFLNEEKGVADKCTWCYHRITKGCSPPASRSARWAPAFSAI